MERNYTEDRSFGNMTRDLQRNIISRILKLRQLIKMLTKDAVFRDVISMRMNDDTPPRSLGIKNYVLTS